MTRDALIACLPWLACWLVTAAVLLVIVRACRATWQWQKLRLLHGDDRGSVQSLSFVLTVPIFVMLLLFIVQVSQLMLATAVVHYAAYAAARSASVWIPAHVDPYDEPENCIATYYPIGANRGGTEYVIRPHGWKYEKIRSAAVLACLPIAPSRDLAGFPPNAQAFSDAVADAYEAVAPTATGNTRLPRRLANKVAYSARHTNLELRFLHKRDEPPLVDYYWLSDYDEFRHNEIGWQDPITATVTHEFALLPGPGRFLAKRVLAPGASTDSVSDRVESRGYTYVYEITASATIGNEGERSVITFEQFPSGGAP